jgi:hypothetical protein
MVKVADLNVDQLNAAFQAATREATRRSDMLTAAVMSLAESNIPPDVQELLLRGDPMRNIPNGALFKAIMAAARSYLRDGKS